MDEDEVSEKKATHAAGYLGGDDDLLHYDADAASFQLSQLSQVSSTRSTRLRRLQNAEQIPASVGGLSVLFNKHPGALPRRRVLSSMDPDARGTKALNLTKFADDEKYKPFLLMLEHGVPLASVWDRCLEAGISPKPLLNDAQGPAVNQQVRQPDKEEEDSLEYFANKAQDESSWRAHRTDWADMQRSSLCLPDTPLLPRAPGLLQQQRVERTRQAAHTEVAMTRAAEGHRPFIPLVDDINVSTSLDRQVGTAVLFVLTACARRPRGRLS